MKKLIAVLCTLFCGVMLLSGCSNIPTSKTSGITGSGPIDNTFSSVQGSLLDDITNASNIATTTSIATSDSLSDDTIDIIEHNGYDAISIGDWWIYFPSTTYRLIDTNTLGLTLDPILGLINTEKTLVLGYSAMFSGNAETFGGIQASTAEITGPNGEDMSTEANLLGTYVKINSDISALWNPRISDAEDGIITGYFALPFVGNGDYTIKFSVFQTFPTISYTINLTLPVSVDIGAVSTSSSKEEIKETLAQQNAVKKAKSYIKSSVFSYEGLIHQLEYEKYSHEDAVYGADHCEADWNEECYEKAQSYLKFGAFSRDGLAHQLEYEKFTPSQIAYALEKVGY